MSSEFSAKKFWVAFILLATLGIALICGLYVYRVQSVQISLKQYELTESAKPTAISHPSTVTSTQIISHSTPNLSVNDKILEMLDCPPSSSVQDTRYCGQDDDQGPLASFECFAVKTADPLLGGLNPTYPLAVCSVRTGKYVHQAGCWTYSGVAYIIEKNGKYKLLDSFSKFKSAFAPIENEDEALSYAIAVTGYQAYYGLETSSDYVYLVSEMEDTHVDKNEQGFIVHLFDYSICGCLQHETYAVSVLVSRDGNVHEIFREAIFRDVALICGD